MAFRESDHLMEYWQILLRRRWIVYLCILGVGLMALVSSFMATPMYRSTVELQIERQSPEVLTFQDLARMDYSYAAYDNFYRTQYRIISSPAVARGAVQELGLTEHPMIAGDASAPGLLSRVKRAVGSLIPSKGEQRSPDPVDAAAGLILSRLEVAPVKDSHLVRVSWVSEDPLFAAEVANAVADAYIEFNFASQYSTSRQAGNFLINEIGRLRDEIAEAERKLQQYGEAKRIISIDDSDNITYKALQEIASRRTEAQTTLAQARAHWDAIRDAEPEALPEVLTSPLISQMRGEYAGYEAEIREMEGRFRPDWPGLRTLRSKLEQVGERLALESSQIASQVRQTTESEYRRALAEVERLEDLVSQHESQALRLKEDAIEYASLEAEVEKKRETLDSLMSRQNEMTLSANLTAERSASTNVKVMETAKPALAPFRPNVKLNIVMGLIFGALLGLGAAFLLESLDNTVLSSADIERVTSLPTLAMIPRYRVDEGGSVLDMITHTDMQCPVAEAYRELRTAILLSHAGEPPRLLMLTSAVPEEGKSSTTLNLSIALAQLGHRVLVVDTDLRRPRLHRVFGDGNRQGVTSYLSGMTDDLDRLAVATAVPNLSFMPSGPIPPNPSELLNSTRFAQMGRRLLDAGFDHVLFDSPPVLSGSDPVIIANVVESSVLVVRAGRTSRQSIRVAVGKLQQSGHTPAGVVLNDVDVRNHAPYYYSYYGSNDDAERRPSTNKRRLIASR